MKHNAATRWFLMTVLGMMHPCVLHAADVTNQAPPSVSTEKAREVEPPSQVPPSPPVTPVRTKIVYKPPLRGAPVVRIDGGSRGSGVSLICLTVLVPDDTALTVQEQPSLFWYQSKPADVPFELTLLAENTVQPLLMVRLADARAAGIQRLNLADHNIKLLVGVEYEWVVALVVDPENRSKDVIASGWIKRVDPSPSLQSRLKDATAEDLPSAYAGEGIWLDSLTAMSTLIETKPRDKALQEERVSLLNQVELTNAAMYAASQITGN